MTKLFNFDTFIALGFSVSTHRDSWDRNITEYSFTRDGIEFTLRKKEYSEFAMGICTSESGERENHIVDEDEALRWFQRTFPDVVL
jgi:hypothetical protein